MTTRLILVLRDVTASSTVKHYIGLPPELTGGDDTRIELGPAAFLVVDVREDGVFLVRYNRDGDCVGDTWHMSVEDAKHQARFEYDLRAKKWENISDDIEDIVQFGLDKIAERQNA